MTPRPHKGELRHVLGGVAVAENGDSDAEDSRLEAADEGQGALFVARLESREQSLIGELADGEPLAGHAERYGAGTGLQIGVQYP